MASVRSTIFFKVHTLKQNMAASRGNAKNRRLTTFQPLSLCKVMSGLIFMTVFSDKSKWKDINNKHSPLKKGPVGSTTFLSSYKCILFLLTTHSILRKWNSSSSKFYYLQWNNLITYWMKFIVLLSEILATLLICR